MKYLLQYTSRFLLVGLLTFFVDKAHGQSENCSLLPPVFVMDFGNASKKFSLAEIQTGNYEQTASSCPRDGSFSFIAQTSGCFGGHWTTVRQDHTPGDIDGKMMLINAAYQPGIFFITPIHHLKGNSKYELSVWMTNVCLSCINDIPVAPQFNFVIETNSGKQLANFVSGKLSPTGSATWVRYAAVFTTPPNPGSLQLKIINKMPGGCGNDFAMDDLVVRECVVQQTAVKTPITAVPKKIARIQPIPNTQRPPPISVATRKPPLPMQLPVPVKDSPRVSGPVATIKAVPVIPPLLVKRDNPVVKRITTTAGEIQVDLYDNGEIDGDTVTIYHNNQLLKARVGLSAKAVSFKLMVDAAQPLHELVMVANNLGSIPPNTSLMVITARNKRYEVFISASEQKNAKIVISLQE